MRKFGTTRKRLVALVATLLMAGTIGVAVAATASSTPDSNATRYARGIPEFGLTRGFFNGGSVNFTYTKGFYCDRAVSAASSSGCEGGATFKNAPNKNFDPLYILVPLGAAAQPRMSMECPTGLVCVDHPGSIDLSRIESALKPLYPSLTNDQLTAALKNFGTPGHEHFLTTLNGGAPEWWDVKIVGVTSKAEYNSIVAHRSAAFLLHEVKAKRTTGVIPTNLFLFFGSN